MSPSAHPIAPNMHCLRNYFYDGCVISGILSWGTAGTISLSDAAIFQESIIMASAKYLTLKNHRSENMILRLDATYHKIS